MVPNRPFPQAVAAQKHWQYNGAKPTPTSTCCSSETLAAVVPTILKLSRLPLAVVVPNKSLPQNAAAQNHWSKISGANRPLPGTVAYWKHWQ